MSRFVLEIELGNDAMQDLDDVARALEGLCLSGFGESGSIRDANGNAVGSFELTDAPPSGGGDVYVVHVPGRLDDVFAFTRESDAHSFALAVSEDCVCERVPINDPEGAQRLIEAERGEDDA